MLPRPGVRQAQGPGEGRRAGARGQGARRRTNRPRAGKRRARHLRGDGHGGHGGVRVRF